MHHFDGCGFFENAAYVTSLGRFVASRYADGLFPRVYRAEDGTAYNVSGNPLRDSLAL